MEIYSEYRTADNGAKVEIGSFTFEGMEFKAIGSVIDESNGVIYGYPCQYVKPDYTIGYTLKTFYGKFIMDLQIKGSAMGFYRTKLTCWSGIYNGKKYSGRNVGTNMFLRMRAGKKV